MDTSFSLNRQQQWIVGGVLLLTMLVTRSHIWVAHIQDASWAIFFLLGFYLRHHLTLPLFLAAAFAIDLLVIESGTVAGQSFCFTISYPFLLPAYASLWFAGRWFARHYSEDLRGAAYLVAAAVVGVVVCDLISSGGFYWFSGRFADLSMAEFLQRQATYTPIFMKTTMVYLGIAAVIHMAFIQAGRIAGHVHHS
jgi:hypothetical protein